MVRSKQNLSLDFSGDSITDNAPTSPVGEEGSTPISPLHKSDLIKAVNACDSKYNKERVPPHEYSSVCICEICLEIRNNQDSRQKLQFDDTKEISYGQYQPKQLRFARLYESEAKHFILPLHYLKRWFVGATLCFGALSPESYLVGAAVLSGPSFRSKRFTARNSKEVRRLVMLDCCGRNSESRFISWFLRETKKLCPNTKYVITYGNPKYDRESAYKAAGFRLDGVASVTGWESHKNHRSIEKQEPKHRFLYIYH